MNNAVEIQINGKTFKLGFGLEVFIKLGEIWDLETLEEVNERFQVLTTFSKAGRTPLKNMVLISEVLEGMILANPENKEAIKAIEIRSLPMNEFQDVMTKLITGFVKSMPQPEQEEIETEKKPKARGKSKSLSPGTL